MMATKKGKTVVKKKDGMFVERTREGKLPSGKTYTASRLTEGKRVVKKQTDVYDATKNGNRNRGRTTVDRNGKKDVRSYSARSGSGYCSSKVFSEGDGKTKEKIQSHTCIAPKGRTTASGKPSKAVYVKDTDYGKTQKSVQFNNQKRSIKRMPKR